MSQQAKTGRKRKDHRDSLTGKYIEGLGRQTDGRWRILGTAKKFTEPDEQKAIQRFYELTGDPEARINEREKARAKQRDVDWAYVGRMIREKPIWVAQQTGVEWLAYGIDLRPPAPLPSFKELEAMWTEHATCKPAEKRQVLADWKTFVAGAGVGGLAEITPEACIAYRDQIYKRNLGGKRQQHLFNRARRILNFAKSRAVAVHACENALIAMRLLKANETTVSLDPAPIEPADFQKLLKAADGDNKAMILLCLNAALHLQECVNLKWANIVDGCLIAHREKKGKFLRIAVLWPETLAALAEVPKRGEHIFYSNYGLPLNISGAGKRFRKLRKDAEVDHVESDQIRDGADPAASEANINDQLHNLLMGWRNPGVKDNYSKRNPQQVKPATDAIYKKYFEAIKETPAT